MTLPPKKMTGIYNSLPPSSQNNNMATSQQQLYQSSVILDRNQSMPAHLDFDVDECIQDPSPTPDIVRSLEDHTMTSVNYDDSADAQEFGKLTLNGGGRELVSPLSKRLDGGDNEGRNETYMMNGNHGATTSHTKDREAVAQPLSSSSTYPAVVCGDAKNKKLVKIKVWDPNHPHSQTAIVTVEMDVRTTHHDNMGGMEQQFANASLGLGELIQIRRSDGNQGGTQSILEIWQSDQEIPNATTTTNDEALPQSEPPQLADPLPTNDTTNPTDTLLPQPVKGLEPFTIPSVISKTIIKSTPTEKVGLAFRKAHGTIVLEKIMPGSPFDGSKIRPGHECLCINGHRVRSARRAAEIVRETTTSLSLMVSDAPRPPGTMYTMIQLGENDRNTTSGYRNSSEIVSAAGMTFKIKHGLVQLVRVDDDSPIVSTSMKVGDFVLAINGSASATIQVAASLLSESKESFVPILYFNMRQLRVSLVDKVIGDLWKKEWSEDYDECVVLQPGGNSNPLTLRFKEEGMCELLDPLRAFRDSNEAHATIPPDHPLNTVVETLNHGIICVLAAIRDGVELAASTGETGGGSENGRKSNSSIVSNLAKLSEMHKEGLLSEEDFEAIKAKLAL